MPDTRDIINIRRRLERWELAHLRALSASLDDQLEAATRRADTAERQAEGWQDHARELQEELLTLAGESGAAIGLTQDGHIGVMKPTAVGASQTPFIGQHLPELRGHYAGIAGDLEGGAPGHLIVLDDAPVSEGLNWADAKTWAESLGDGARLPTKAEAALLFSNVKDKFTDEMHWTGTQYSSRYAWCQRFLNGGQFSDIKDVEARARAVRRLPLEYFNTLGVGAP